MASMIQLQNLYYIAVVRLYYNKSALYSMSEACTVV